MSRSTYTADGLLGEAAQAPLSTVLPRVLSAARQIGDKALADWVRLELSGYFNDNPALTPETMVPEYRTVAGQHYDRNMGPITFQNDELRFLNSDRLRFGVGTLESLAAKEDLVCVASSSSMEILRQQFGANPHKFCFSPHSVQGVLDAIRTRLVDLLEDRRDRLPAVTSQLASDATAEGRSVGRRIFAWARDSVWQVVLLVVAAVIAAYLIWRFGWT